MRQKIVLLLGILEIAVMMFLVGACTANTAGTDAGVQQMYTVAKSDTGSWIMRTDFDDATCFTLHHGNSPSISCLRKER
jgi:hypothetical protein